HLPGLRESPSAFISHQALYQSGVVAVGSLPQAAIVPTCSTVPALPRGGVPSRPTQIAVLALGVVHDTVGCFQRARTTVKLVDGGNSPTGVLRTAYPDQLPD